MITHLITAFGYVGVFVLMTLESVFIPIPSEVTMPFAGFMAEQGRLSLWLVIFLGAFGNLVGSWIAYYIGHIIEEDVLVRWIRQYGHYILITEKDYDRAVRWFHRYGSGAVFFSRLLPAVRTFISLPAGMFQMSLVKFSTYTFFGSLLWSGFLAFIGYYLGNQWGSIEPLVSKAQYVVVGLALAAVCYYVYRRTRTAVHEHPAE